MTIQSKYDEINAILFCIRIYGVACQEYSHSRSSGRLSTKYYYKLPVAILLFIRVKHKPVVIYNIIPLCSARRLLSLDLFL